MYIITHIQCRSTAYVHIHMTLSLCPQADGAEKYRSKRKRLGSTSSRSAAKMQKTEVTVAARTDLRAKFYSKVTRVKFYLKLLVLL